MPSLEIKPPRSAFGPPKADRQVQFLHPGYQDGRNLLIALPALDSGGVHHETARVACAILANASWHGFLSVSRDDPAIEQGPDEILMEDSYYFCIQGGMFLDPPLLVLGGIILSA